MTTKTTFSISYYCRSCKTNKQGLAPLEICINIKRYNSYLKELQKLSGIGTVITTHLCRKTYAHYMSNNGVRIETGARLLGHSNTNITHKIYCRKTTETIANEVAQIIKVA